MTPNHNYFEFLCALAASDELTEPELNELREHSLECVACGNRIHEMTKINACLLLSHAFNHRNRRLPKGMQERFIARAIKEGVPLKPPSTVGLANLGLASAVFIILLVTAAAIRTGPFSRPVVDANHFDAAQLSKPVRVTTPMLPDSTMSRLPRRRDRSRGAKSRRVQVQWRLDRSEALPSHLETFKNRYFPAALSSPHSMLAVMPSDAGRLSSWPYVPSRFSLAVGPGLIRESALRLLADSEYGTANPMTLPSEFTFATPGAPGFHPSLDRDLYRTHPIFEFRDTPLKFHFVGNVTQ
jgi:hypothetical protein